MAIANPRPSAKEREVRIATYGRIIGITRQVIINDDLGVFTNMAQKLATRLRVWNRRSCGVSSSTIRRCRLMGRPSCQLGSRPT